MKTSLLTRELACRVLEGAGRADVAGQVRSLMQFAGNGFSADAGEVLADHLLRRAEDQGGLDAAFSALDGEGSSLAWFVRARLLASGGDPQAAVEALSRSLAGLAAPDPYVLLNRARLLAKQQRFEQAASDLQSALRLFPPYSFFIKCEKVLDRVIDSGAWSPRRKAKLAILASSTTALLAPVLRAAAFRGGLQLDVYQGVYGNYQQEILDPQSGLYRFQPDIVILLVNHHDLVLPPLGGKQAAQQYAARLRHLWEVLRGRHSCHIVQAGLDLPPPGAWGSLEDSLPEGRRRALTAANLALADDLPEGVSFVDVNALIAQHGSAFWSDAEWHKAKQYPSTSAIPLAADAFCAHCLAVLGLTCKVLALDLDNTLWGGVIGEDLLGGIRIGPPTAEGEGYGELQQYVKELHQRGVLLAVCTKNDLADAEEPFRKHDAMRLRRDDFAAFAANWQDKAANLETMAAELRLGLDSFVFLDDNPAERAQVRLRLPQVVVPECGSTPWEMLAALRRGMYFENTVLTREDMERNESYRGNLSRNMLRQNAATLDDFLADLQMEAEYGPVDDATLTRVTQLVNKTNQFNATGRRYTDQQVAAMAQSPDWWCRWFKLADRFGDYGLVGVILSQRQGIAWRIDTWLVSCRAIGRQLERFMGSLLLGEARSQGAAEVRGEYIPTQKNALVKDLFPQLGFQPVDGNPRQYVFRLSEEQLPSCGHIRARSQCPSR